MLLLHLTQFLKKLLSHPSVIFEVPVTTKTMPCNDGSTFRRFWKSLARLIRDLFIDWCMAAGGWLISHGGVHVRTKHTIYIPNLSWADFEHARAKLISPNSEDMSTQTNHFRQHRFHGPGHRKVEFCPVWFLRCLVTMKMMPSNFQNRFCCSLCSL